MSGKPSSFGLDISSLPPGPFSTATAEKTEESEKPKKACETTLSSSNEKGKKKKVSAPSGIFQGLGDALSKSPNKLQSGQASSGSFTGLFGDPKADSQHNSSVSPVSVALTQTGKKDFQSVLTEFYQKHNPAKIHEVEKTLDKYKVKFDKNSSLSRFFVCSS